MRLAPAPQEAGRCPRDDAPLAVGRLHLIGARWLVRGRCTGPCGHRWVQDLPTGHGLVYPTSVDLDTGETFGMWFGHLLLEGLEAPDTDPVDLRVHRSREAGDVVVLSCLDFVYGHALLRLLNAQRHLDAGDDLVVVVPAALEHLVPDGVAERWVLHEPLGRLRGWLAALDERARAELLRLPSACLAPAFPHPHPSTWDLRRFTGPLAPEPMGRPSVVWVARADRLWGSDASEQERNVADLWAALRAEHSGIGGAVVGVARPGAAPGGMVDLRSERPDQALERRWLDVLAGADLAVGTHGSSLLLPSGLARATIELLPETRWSNAGQATLVTQTDPLTAVLRHRTIMGDESLDDVAPRRVAAVALGLLAGDDRIMTGPASGIGSDPVVATARRDRAPVFTREPAGLLERAVQRVRRGFSAP